MICESSKNPRCLKTLLSRKTHKCLSEANDKVWSLNRQTEKALDTLVILYERSEQVKNSFVNVEFEEMKEALEIAEAQAPWRHLRKQYMTAARRTIFWRQRLARLRVR